MIIKKPVKEKKKYDGPSYVECRVAVDQSHHKEVKKQPTKEILKGKTMMTRDEQRAKDTNNKMACVGLYCHLLNLMDEILNGRSHKLTDFQEFIQYAPPTLKVQVLQKLAEKQEEMTKRVHVLSDMVTMEKS